MAKRTQREPSGVVEDPLVASLVPDPSQGPPNTTVLAGYLGRGTDARDCRLYLTPDLTERLEFAVEDILHRESLPDDSTQIWVRSDLNVRYVRSQVQQLPASQIGRASSQTLPPGPRLRRTAGTKSTDARTTAGALPFALATAHHAPAQMWGDEEEYYLTSKMRRDKKRKDEQPKHPWGDKFPWKDDPGYAVDPLAVQYDLLLTDYLELVAAHEELRQQRG